MKKIIFAVCFLFMTQILVKSLAFADEIIDNSGNITPCKIETIVDGLVEYRKNGNLYSFQREKNQPVFNDYVDVRNKLFKRNSTIRYSGKILIKDSEDLKIRNEKGDMLIPWYRVKFIGVYKSS